MGSYTTMPDTDLLLDLVHSLYVSRYGSYPYEWVGDVRNRGHLKDEVMVYEMLVRIFRSPELIARLTEHKPGYHCVKRSCEEVI